MAGNLATLGKARRELEELYSGIPDESVNLTFQDFAQVRQLPTTTPPPVAAAAADQYSNKSIMKASGSAIASTNINTVRSSSSSSALTKLPSLDFNKAFEEASTCINHQNTSRSNKYNHESSRNNNSYYVGTTTDHRKFYSDRYGEEAAALHASHLGTSTDRRPAAGQDSNYDGSHVRHHHHNNNHHQTIGINTVSSGGYHHHQQQAAAAGVMGLKGEHHHDSIMSSSGGTSSSMMMMSNNFMDSFQGGSSSIGGTRRRRPGIPHTNICSICSVYIYMFRNNRCLVCGRVYCRQCVSIGMGEMTEGRKCIQCLGKRFSQRYIDRAGKAGGCCMGFLDSSSTSRAKQREMEWAEKGPRKSNGNNTTATTATPSRNYMNNYSASPTTPTAHAHAPPPDFSRSSSPYSPYTTHSPASSYHFPL